MNSQEVSADEQECLTWNFIGIISMVSALPHIIKCIFFLITLKSVLDINR